MISRLQLSGNMGNSRNQWKTLDASSAGHLPEWMTGSLVNEERPFSKQTQISTSMKAPMQGKQGFSGNVWRTPTKCPLISLVGPSKSEVPTASTGDSIIRLRSFDQTGGRTAVEAHQSHHTPGPRILVYRRAAPIDFREGDIWLGANRDHVEIGISLFSMAAELGHTNPG
ncbi:hypothetical protein CC1G_13784 [Coprinopsis cinerea okayama7|uniref:Uncharacterized protein n=1 Tax=Coprinopsis cinerea (strain Okayama-7 / 130 / ATCC MYA-4618 / FGSC 9003) TaxID=240176 RepID=D6RK91_COPC7|nr:hypothetical protein CC1G_13784 [Coprinopsis cinerea okayama7\|eukprot:XP_002912252.1 hypothetical protein CC1G_13784 [Coprinopsis cinerea okayama7\